MARLIVLLILFAGLVFAPRMAQPADFFWGGEKQFFSNAGAPLSAGTINTYDSGTTDNRTVYKDSGEVTPHTNPIVLDSNGRLPAAVYIPSGAWKYLLKDSSGTTIHTEDAVPGAVTTVTVNFQREKCPTQAKTADYTVTTGDAGDCFLVAPAAATTLTLPSAITIGDGQEVTVKKTNANAFTVTVATVGSQTIDGVGTSRIIYSPNELIRLVSDGANWHIISHTSETSCPIVAKTGAYTVVTADDRVCFHGGTNAFTFTLPSAVTVRNGWRVSFRNTNDDNDDITVATVSSQTINGSGTSRVLDSLNEVLELVSDGTNWQIVGDIGATEKTFQLPVGAIILWSDDDACPSGFEEFDGSGIAVASYPELFNLWSDDDGQTAMYGESVPGTTFEVGDSRGRFPRHIPDGAGNQDPDAASRQDRGDGTTGDVPGTLQDDATDEHTHDPLGGIVVGATFMLRGSSGGTLNAGAGSTQAGAGTTGDITSASVAHTPTTEVRGTNIGFRFCVFADSTP